MQQDIIQLPINEISPSEVPIHLLMLADPSEKKIAGYLSVSICFAVWFNEEVVGVCVVTPIHRNAYELMNISVAPSYQQKGIGTQLLRHAIASIGRLGAEHLEVGTGTFGYQLKFYQRQGFRVSRIDKDFFIKNYEEPIFEDGIQLRDMLRLVLIY
jgi:ribosomal protein S18 acetylase RimI-like enzyme